MLKTITPYEGELYGVKIDNEQAGEVTCAMLDIVMETLERVHDIALLPEQQKKLTQLIYEEYNEDLYLRSFIDNVKFLDDFEKDIENLMYDQYYDWELSYDDVYCYVLEIMNHNFKDEDD